LQNCTTHKAALYTELYKRWYEELTTESAFSALFCSKREQ
jgi:hypothetical protein